MIYISQTKQQTTINSLKRGTNDHDKLFRELGLASHPNYNFLRFVLPQVTFPDGRENVEQNWAEFWNWFASEQKIAFTDSGNLSIVFCVLSIFLRRTDRGRSCWHKTEHKLQTTKPTSQKLHVRASRGGRHCREHDIGHCFCQWLELFLVSEPVFIASERLIKSWAQEFETSQQRRRKLTLKVVRSWVSTKS